MLCHDILHNPQLHQYLPQTLLQTQHQQTFNDAAIIEGTLNAICAISLADVNNVISSDPSSCITYEELVDNCQTDDQYELLPSIVETGFPKT